MNKKLNCQLINILLDKDYQFANKYTSIMSGNFDYEEIVENYFNNKNMKSIKINNDTQSVCFTNQNGLVSFYNSETRKTEQYYEEVHIHCNDLSIFNDFTKYLKSSKYSSVCNEQGGIPHEESINIENLKSCTLIMKPMTNEVATTKSLLNLLSKNSDETIFRAIAIHFGKLVDKNSEINFDLINSLNSIYQKYAKDSETSFFSDEVSNRLLNINNDEKSFETRITKVPSKSFDINDSEYVIGEEYFENEL